MASDVMGKRLISPRTKTGQQNKMLQCSKRIHVAFAGYCRFAEQNAFIYGILVLHRISRV